MTQLQVINRGTNNQVLSGVDNSANDIIGSIVRTNLLSKEDANSLLVAKEFVLSTYTDVPEYRPLVIKLSSVLNDANFPTPDAKYWQCKKESEVHFNQLILETYKYERCIVDVEEMDYIIASLEKEKEETDKDPVKLQFEIRRLKIKLNEYLFNMKSIEKSIKYRIKEVSEWAAIANKMLKDNCKYSTSNYEEHITESLYKKLENSDGDNYKSQLSTLKRLIVELSKNNNN